MGVCLLLGLLCFAAPLILQAEEKHDSPSNVTPATVVSNDALPAMVTVSAAALTAVPPATSALDLGDLYMVEHRYAAAIDAYKRAPANLPSVWNKMGMAYHHLFALEEARKHYEHAIKLNPHYAEALNNLGAVFHGEKDFRHAVKSYKLAIRYQPGMAVAYKNLGVTYFATHNFRRGLDAYHRAMVLDPQIFITRPGLVEEGADQEQRISMHYALAKLYAQNGSNAQAIAALRSAVREGFKDGKQLRNDRDLSRLTQTPEFQQAFDGRIP